jgi:Tfp pilus assembly PilM family ATPase
MFRVIAGIVAVVGAFLLTMPASAPGEVYRLNDVVQVEVQNVSDRFLFVLHQLKQYGKDQPLSTTDLEKDIAALETAVDKAERNIRALSVPGDPTIQAFRESALEFVVFARSSCGDYRDSLASMERNPSPEAHQIAAVRDQLADVLNRGGEMFSAVQQKQRAVTQAFQLGSEGESGY